MKMLKDKKNRKLRIISFVILFLAAIVFLAPYFWMLSNSFKSTKEILLEPTNMLPKQFTLDGYVKVITDSPFFRWMGNSLFVTVIDTLVVLFTSSLIGFVLSKYKFKLNKFLFYVILITMMMPTAAMMIPNFLLISKLGWYDKIISLVVPTFVNAFGIFLCKQFIDDMPKELFECAMLDNAGPFTIYRKIVLPGIRPALGSLTIFTFLGLWNDYQTPFDLFEQLGKYDSASCNVVFFNSAFIGSFGDDGCRFPYYDSCVDRIYYIPEAVHQRNYDDRNEITKNVEKKKLKKQEV